jgi:hypothetical protein
MRLVEHFIKKFVHARLKKNKNILKHAFSLSGIRNVINL